MISAKDYANAFWEAGHRVFGLHSVTNGACDCGHAGCEAFYKHPRVSNWQHTPHWSEDQIAFMTSSGQFDSGFGVVCKGLLVIDVDAKNGGIESFARLSDAVPAIGAAGLIVATGSGNGSRHLYFKAPSDIALVTTHQDYNGIEFKSSGYVVGPGSMHKSGNQYTVGIGSIDEIEDAPSELIDILKRPERHRAMIDGMAVDVSQDELAGMLSAIDPDCSYEVWIRCGMAVHHATGGTGRDVWDQWSSKGTKYDSSKIDNHWHSFGRSQNPVTLGTLVHHAETGGWVKPVSFGGIEATQDDIDAVAAMFAAPIATEKNLLDTTGIDLKRPPGFVGEIAQWIEDQSRRPRENLAVAGALSAIGNIAGLHYTDDRDGVNTNLFTFCVAGSRTGKESIQQAVADIHRAAGYAAATHGTIKSEQEIVRNLLDHQAALYVIDEIGILLQKISSAQSKGGANYLVGVIGQIMAAYSKASGYMLLTGDQKRELRAALNREAAAVNKQIDDGVEGLDRRMASIMRALQSVDSGLEKPFLSLIGFTTPVTFDDLVTYEAAVNGLIGRSLLFNERDTAPRSKSAHFKRAPMTEALSMALMQIGTGGHYDAGSTRIEHYGERIAIPTTAEASEMLTHALDWFEDQAIDHKAKSGLEALYLGAYELVSKVSLILAIPSGVREPEHVRWAFALIKRDVDEKARLVTANDRAKDAPELALMAKILNVIGEDGERESVIVNRLRPNKKEPILAAIQKLIDSGKVERVVIKSSGPRVSDVSLIKPC